ncbi:hypothetical protein ACHAWO_011323 [Cyclotella atomus]|uniref:Uncharacterized protein n=1 Tax=Cyclotella atomus TaxID=382360 RepID=A0ABD3N132_9STRA
MGLHFILRTSTPNTNLSALSDFQPLTSTDAITNDPWKRELFQRLDNLRKKCGNLCAVNTLDDIDKYGDRIPNPNGNFMSLKVPIHCPNILQLEEMDAGDASLPYPPPDELLPYYTMDGAIDFVLQKKYDNIYLGGDAKTSIWSKEYIDEQIIKLKTYTQDETYRGAGRCMLQKLEKWTNLKDKSVLVIGSERPWLEVIILSLGAAQVTTLEYGKIESHHPQVRALTPNEFRAKAIDGTLGEFDGIISHSSLEHAGLGRYGDALNPYGDLLNVARASCVTKSDGFLVLGLPTGRDAVQFNGARVYGKIRWSLVTANFVQIDGEDHTEAEFTATYGRGCGGGQIFVFQKQ